MVLGALNTYELNLNGKGMRNDELIIGNPEVTIEFTNEIYRFITDHIYELTAVSRDISGNWKTAKEALEKYAFDLLSAT